MDESRVASDRKNYGPVNSLAKNPGVEIKTDGSSRMVLIRGLPGSGKSTMATVLSLLGYKHFEADMFFVGDDGVYRHDGTRLKSAHAWCQDKVRNALKDGNRVVVSNTFTQHWEMQPYFDMGVSIQILEAGGNWSNRHGVPEEKVKSMRDRWVSLPSAYACARWSVQ
jgi:hypothetical protein